MPYASELVRSAGRTRPAAVALAGSAAVVGLGVATVPVRPILGGANVALLMALVVVATAAYGGRRPAIAVSLIAALVFNVLHTEPYLSLKIDEWADVITTSLLAIVGIVAGELTELAWRHRDAELNRARQVEQLHRIAELASSASDAAAIWPTVRDTLCAELHLGRCWFEPASYQGLPFPQLEHSGAIGRSDESRRWRPGGFELPRNGVGLSVSAEGRTIGRLVMLPDPGHGLSPIDRRMAVAVADQFGMVAARSDPLEPLW